MKKASIFFIAMFLGIAFNGFSQTATATDFFAGKWEFLVKGTPNGDAKFITNLVRKDGKLTGDLTDPNNADKPKIPITSIVESADKIVIYFTAESYDVDLSLAKVDDNNLNGTLMNMFESTGKRIMD